MFGRNKKTTRKGQAPAKKKQNSKTASGASGKKAAGSTKKTAAKKTAAKKRSVSSAKNPKAKAPSKTKASAKSSAKPSGTKAASASPTRRKAPAKKNAAKKGSSVASKRSSARKTASAKKAAAKKSPIKKGSKQESSLKVSTKTAAAKRPAKKMASSSKRVKTGHAPPIKPPFEAYNGIRPYLFTSYAHHDMKAVFGVIKKLHKKRYRIWYDEGIEPGNEWPEIVGKAIVNCTQSLVLMSPHAAISRNVRNEINLAFTENKNILVVFLKKTSLTEGMKLQIGTMQFINKYELSEREFFEKLDKVIDSSMKN